MPAPDMDMAIAPVPAQEPASKVGELKGDMLGRVADYLPKRIVERTGNKKTPDGV